MADDDGFLSRWSRRKALVKQGVPVASEPPLPAADAPVAPAVRAEAPSQVAPQVDESAAPDRPPSPTLEEVAALTKDSDFSRFVAPDVDPGVKNAAMKKLFASDPHFNTMDGLDVYIDDYNKFEPIPKSVLRQLVNARVLGLIDDELEEQPRPDNSGADEDADLQLQPDDAAGRGGADARVADGGAAEPAAPDAVPPRST
jgi:hypothetical protein